MAELIDEAPRVRGECPGGVVPEGLVEPADVLIGAPCTPGVGMPDVCGDADESEELVEEPRVAEGGGLCEFVVEVRTVAFEREEGAEFCGGVWGGGAGGGGRDGGDGVWEGEGVDLGAGVRVGGEGRRGRGGEGEGGGVWGGG